MQLSFALIALFSWPLVSFVMFQAMPPVRALIWTVLGGYLFLPGGVGIDLPMLPQFDKNLIPALSASVFILFAQAREDRQNALRARGANGPVRVPAKRLQVLFAGLIAALLVLPVGVHLTNGERYIYEFRTLPSVKVYDIFSMALNASVMLLPFVLGRRFLATAKAHREFLMAMAIFGIIYALLMIVEMRLSPQLNRWLYGFFPHSWAQHVRGGAFRPIVFLDHGLRVAIFVATATLAAITLARLDKGLWWLPAIFMALVLLISPNLGAAMILVAIGSVAVFANLKTLRLAVALIAGLVLLYPMLRGANLVPLGPVLSLAEQISPRRAGSLQFRLNNEDILLEKANQKPFFGWGSWGRNRVYDERGMDISTTDGVWVIVMGTTGWLGYLAIFGMLTLPLILPVFKIGRPPDKVTIGLSIVLAANLIDLLPNSSLTPVTWLMAGALAGRLQWQTQAAAAASHPSQRRRRGAKPPDTAPDPDIARGGRRAPVYSRFNGPVSARDS